MIPNSERTNAAVAFVDGAPMLLCCFDFGTIPLRIGVGSCCEGGCIVTEIWGVYITLGAQNQSAYAQILSNTNFEHKGALVNDVIFVGTLGFKKNFQKLFFQRGNFDRHGPIS